MKAMILNKYGADAIFTSQEISTPTAKEGQVLVKIAASSVNTVDTMIRQMGADLPISPATPALLGMDFAGTISAVGSGVTGFAVGDEVYGCDKGDFARAHSDAYNQEQIDALVLVTESVLSKNVAGINL